MLFDSSLALRPWTADGAAAVLAACQDRERQRWMDIPVPYPREHVAAVVGEDSRREWASRQGAPVCHCGPGNGQEGMVGGVVGAWLSGCG